MEAEIKPSTVEEKPMKMMNQDISPRTMNKTSKDTVSALEEVRKEGGMSRVRSKGEGGGGSEFHYLLLNNHGARFRYLQKREESDLS